LNISVLYMLIIKNILLSSILIYTTGVYRINKVIHQQMDTIRAKFFWRSADNKFKYDIIKSFTNKEVLNWDRSLGSIQCVRKLDTLGVQGLSCEIVYVSMYSLGYLVCEEQNGK
jgi:hypothetical protein